MNALVTGAAGFIGSHVVEALLDRGATVVGLDCFTSYYPRAIKESNLARVRGRMGFSFLDVPVQHADLDSLLRNATHVFHLAAQAGVRKSWGREFDEYLTQNVEATQILLEACVGRSLTRMVYASSSSVYGDAVSIPMREDGLPQPLSPYGVTKLAAEQLCRLYFTNHGVPTVSLRFFTVYGPRQRPDMAFYRFLSAGMAGRPVVVYGDGEQTRDFTYVSDIVAATLAAANQGAPGGVYNVGGGSRVSVNHVLDLVAQVVGRRLDVWRKASQKGDLRDTYADTSRARGELGFVPRVSLSEGLEAEHRWLESTSVLTK